nr:flagellar basal body P-ring protein FlgI [Campylobacter sp.]
MKIKGLFVVICAFVCISNATMIKDVANIVGVRENQLIGYGLVVGLNGSGDGSSSEFTIQSISNMLQTVNVKVNPDDIKSKNTAAVMVTAKLPPFARQGDKLDVTISSIGDAKSLMGGTLLMTALKGVDGGIYALAQGPLSIGGGSSGARGGGNHPTVASLPEGALVEQEVVYDFSAQQFVVLSLRESNFDVATKVQNAINSSFKNTATAVDPRTIRLNKPAGYSMVEFLSKVLDIKFNYKPSSKIIIDERTGTIVSGVDIEIEPAIISHGNITLKIEPNSYVDPDPNNIDPNKVEMGSKMSINTATNTLNIGSSRTTVANVTRALNKLGASPKEIIAILENLKRMGAISVPLEII